MLGNLFCNYCNKWIGDYANAYFSDREKNLDFCSEDCFSKWSEQVARWKKIHPDFTPELQKQWEKKESAEATPPSSKPDAPKQEQEISNGEEPAIIPVNTPSPPKKHIFFSVLAISKDKRTTKEDWVKSTGRQSAKAKVLINIALIEQNNQGGVIAIENNIVKHHLDKGDFDNIEGKKLIFEYNEGEGLGNKLIINNLLSLTIKELNEAEQEAFYYWQDYEFVRSEGDSEYFAPTINYVLDNLASIRQKFKEKNKPEADYSMSFKASDLKIIRDTPPYYWDKSQEYNAGNIILEIETTETSDWKAVKWKKERKKLIIKTKGHNTWNLILDQPIERIIKGITDRQFFYIKIAGEATETKPSLLNIFCTTEITFSKVSKTILINKWGMLAEETNETPEQTTTDTGAKMLKMRCQADQITQEAYINLTTEDWERWRDNISSDFTENLVREWTDNSFSYEAVNDLISIGLAPQDANYATWLRDIKKVDPEWVLNHGDSEGLFTEYQQSTATEETNSTFHLNNSLNNLNQHKKDEGTQTQITGGDIDELQQQVSSLTIERDNLESELNQERQAHAQSQERRRLESDQQVLRDQLGNEEATRIIDNQNLRWQRQGGNN